MQHSNNKSLPTLIAGPILRHVSSTEVTLWLVTSTPSCLSLSLFTETEQVFEQQLTQEQHQTIDIGKHAYIHLVTLTDVALKTEQNYYYDFTFHYQTQNEKLSEIAPALLYQSQQYCSFTVPDKVERMLHGSCRKPHFPSDDGLAQVDAVIEQTISTPTERPALLMMSGDQVYADDVAGPMLSAIHQVIALLGLYDETWQGAVINHSQQLYDSEFCYYHRERLLPHTRANEALYDKFFAASKKPIFTSVNAKNHLVTLAECFAMYLLVWSSAMWRLVEFNTPDLSADDLAKFTQEQQVLTGFQQTLPQVARALAHIPTYMIFDDHDITDDWNLTRGWEEAAYGHPFSKRIIGNSLIAYWLCQGWGNAPKKFTALNKEANKYFAQGYLQLDELVERVLDWQDWHYSLQTTPKIVVLDTRTQRWRSESRSSKPSGLMDWEALSEMQQELINEPQVILVSAAPIYGVKMIETIQRIFTFFGQPLMVDAENWMAHKGTANVMLNIFRHVKTPPEFIILSGDVHYSFVYDVSHRFQRSQSKIVQITSSGIKNKFPDKLLNALDRLNRALYGPYSPLNWFTKRRNMKVRVRKPSNSKKGLTLVNASGIGEIRLTHDEHIVQVNTLTASGEAIHFTVDKDEAS
ncbi:metallophosphoesterase family protein [Thalassotalea hakodatensis]|uniref:alkaline phosphatase family protein n=1 Tax=Thalassotalea hakodatensis TaxID=3030492 RepID=UPI002573E23D|nr:alkaline phosphatase family protein [Thalassotalea hakodatensis]